MPSISSNMHFGKLFLENSHIKINIPSFVLGLVSPETIDEDDFDDYHSLDEDGNIDVREFYEQFDFNELNEAQKSFVLGYYCHLWFYEYYKFNASKLKIYNSVELTDEELSLAVNSLLKYYDYKAINNFFHKYINEIKGFNVKLNLKEIGGICLNKSKEKVLEFINDTEYEVTRLELIKEEEYMNFIKKGCSKILKSL